MNFETLNISPNSKRWPWLERTCNSAAAAFTKLDFPTSKTEDWRYTSVKKIITQDYLTEDHIPVIDSKTINDIKQYIIADALAVVYIDGVYYPQLSSLYSQKNKSNLSDFTQLFNIADMTTAQSQVLNKAFVTHIDKIFPCLNQKFMQDGLYLEVGANKKVTKKIQIINYITDVEKSLMISPKNIINLAHGSELSLVETFVSSADTTTTNDAVVFMNSLLDISLAKNATLHHYQQYLGDSKTQCINQIYTDCAQEADYNNHAVVKFGALVRREISVNLNETGAKTSLNGVYIAHNQDHIDQKLQINHNAAATYSSQLFKGVLDDSAKAVFAGSVFMAQQAHKSNADQINRNLLLSDNCEVNSKPVLQIDVDDVKCSHGSTVGQLDSEQLFYLESRALSFDLAKRILLKAYVDEVILQVADVAVSDFMQKLIRGSFDD